MRSSTVLALALTSLLVGACGEAQDREEGWGSSASASDVPVKEEIEVPPPPFSEGVFPCSDCHDPTLPTNTKRRKLQMAHQEIDLKHDVEHRWCLDCHS